MKEQILKLRSEGKSYNEIVIALGCSKSNVSFHCGKGQKEKNKNRTIINRKKPHTKVAYRVDIFRARVKQKSNGKYFSNTIYAGRDSESKNYVDKIINNPYCYLTGEKIDLDKNKSYCLDHKIPYSISQDNSIENMGLCTVLANKAKSDMEIEDFLELCKKVLIYHDYKVSKN